LRERWEREREVAAREIQMREGEEEGAHGGVGRRGHASRAGLGWAGLHRGSKPTTHTTIKRN
jgi:epoxyqueuosine reductase QueG